MIGFLEQLRANVQFAAIPIILLTTTQHVESVWEGSRFIVYQRDGLFPSEVLNGLNGMIEGLKPRSYIRAVP
jgi:hypothetical protein